MANHPNRGRSPRPLELLHAVGRDYPNAWMQIETFRAGRDMDLPDWPDWCFLPMAAWYAIVSAGRGLERLSPDLTGDVGRLAALGAWRYTQGIYRLDTDLRAAVADTVPSGALPVDALYRLPEWSLYIETPGSTWHGEKLHGFWAHLERDVNTGRDELRLLIDSNAGLVPIPIHLGPWTITEAVDRSVSEAKRQASAAGFSAHIPGEFISSHAAQLYPLISLLLYVISNGVDYPDDNRPSNPSPKRTKKGWRLFPAAKPRIWQLGDKTGRAIRAARDQAETGQSRKGPVPHVRRAHWHGYWFGPRDGERELIIKWLPPTAVAADE